MNAENMLFNTMHSISTMMQFELLNNLKSNGFMKSINEYRTKYEILNALIPIIMYLIVTVFFMQLPSMFTSLKNYFCSILDKLRILFMFIYRKIKKERKVYEKNVEIGYLTPTKTKNHLFRAVHWYITKHDNESNLLKETPLTFSCEDKIDEENINIKNGTFKINKTIAFNNWKTIIFKDHKISYKFSSSLVTLYNTSDSEKGQQRDNFQIFLRTLIDDYISTDILDEFCQFCVNEYVKSLTSNTWEQKIFTNKGDKWESQLSGNQRRFETIILKDSLREKIINDIRLFLRSENWYKSRGIPYSRGYLFYGTPGTGKSSMIRAISNECKKTYPFPSTE